MFRKTVFASLIALGAAAGVAQAADDGPRLVNRNGDQEVVYGPQRGNVLGGAYASITGGGENTTYSAVPGSARFEQPRLVARLLGGGDNEQVIYTAPEGQASRALAGQTAAGPRG